MCKCGCTTAYLLKLTDCQLPVDAQKIKVHDVSWSQGKIKWLVY